MFCQSPLSSEDCCLWFRLETLGPSSSAILTAVVMEHIVTTTTLQMLTPDQGLEMAHHGCPMYFVNSWALGWSRDT